MSVAIEKDELDRVFGPVSTGDTSASRALSSEREFVRGQHMLAVASDEAQGRRLSAFEALQTFGFAMLRQAVVEGQAAIVRDRSEPAETLRKRRQALGLDLKKFARVVGLKPAEVAQAETSGRVSPIRLIEQMTPSLAIDERYLGLNHHAIADPDLGVRFRTLAVARDGVRALSTTAVAKLAEAAWVISRQETLAANLEEVASSARDRFIPDGDYSFPTYACGYRLAERTREILGIGATEPISNLRRLIENDLRIPLVETELGGQLAGATIANGEHRGIVVNIEGRNENVWVRRMTLAHELGHLLWDPSEKLENLMVDRYDELPGETRKLQDPVEIRANAFAIALLAPPRAVDSIIREQSDLWSGIAKVSEDFGISITASRAHVGNLFRITVPSSGGRSLPMPSDEWKARENYTNDFFPLHGTPPARAGRFAWTVISAMDRRVISPDTAATLLKATIAEITDQKERILELTAA